MHIYYNDEKDTDNEVKVESPECIPIIDSGTEGVLEIPPLQRISEDAHLDKENGEKIISLPIYTEAIIDDRPWVDGDIIYSKDRRKKPQKVCSTFAITKIIRNVDTCESFVEIEFGDKVWGENNVVTVPQNISKNQLVSVLAEKGMVIFDNNKFYMYFLYYLSRIQDAIAPRRVRVEVDGEAKFYYDYINACLEKIQIHQKVGWMYYKDELAFAGEKIFTINGDVISEYKGNLQIAPKGSYESYCNMLKQEVVGNVQLETILGIGASATLIGFFNRVFDSNLYNPVYHIYGTTSTGKTTAAMLYTSFGGNPVVGRKDTLFLNFNGTMLSLIKKMSLNKGFPICIDELSMCGSHDITKELYALAGGTEKERLTRNGDKLQEKSEFESAILTTGEGRILTRTNGNGGLSGRVIELSTDSWTASEANSDNIKAVTSCNYGHITPRLAKYLLKKLNDGREKEVFDRFKFWKDNFVKEADKRGINDNIIKRLSNFIALVMLGLELLQEIVNIEFHLDDVFDFMVQQVIANRNSGSQLGDKAYDYFLEFYYHNKKDLWYKHNYNCTGNEWGAYLDNKSAQNIRGRECNHSVGITKLQAEEIFVKKGHFEDVEVIMKEFKNKGYIMTHDTKRLTARFLYNSNIINVGYRILVPDEITSWDNEFYEID